MAGLFKNIWVLPRVERKHDGLGFLVEDKGPCRSDIFRPGPTSARE